MPSVETVERAAGSHAVAGKYLTFSSGAESYGIPVLQVREIIKLAPITAVPQMPAEIKGVVNLRGKIIPVIDLRLKFGLARTENSERTCIIVVEVNSTSHARVQMGLIVDGVEEVANIAAADIEQTPDFGASLDTEYILGMAKIKGAIKMLLDIDKVIAAGAVELLQVEGTS
jgi:purine-binding chemotaxis protein CheW